MALCFPAYQAHHLQPLDEAFFELLHKYYNNAVTQWLGQNRGRMVTFDEVCKLVSSAYEKAFPIENTST